MAVPASIRWASHFSSGAVSSGTRPISLRYTRTESAEPPSLDAASRRRGPQAAITEPLVEAGGASPTTSSRNGAGAATSASSEPSSVSESTSASAPARTSATIAPTVGSAATASVGTVARSAMGSAAIVLGLVELDAVASQQLDDLGPPVEAHVVELEDLEHLVEGHPTAGRATPFQQSLDRLIRPLGDGGGNQIAHAVSIDRSESQASNWSSTSRPGRCSSFIASRCVCNHDTASLYGT